VRGAGIDRRRHAMIADDTNFTFKNDARRHIEFRASPSPSYPLSRRRWRPVGCIPVPDRARVANQPPGAR
jgi:hypothetical protein